MVTIEHTEDNCFLAEPRMDDQRGEIKAHTATGICFLGNAVEHQDIDSVYGEREEHVTEENGEQLEKMVYDREDSTSTTSSSFHWQTQSNATTTPESLNILVKVQQNEDTSSATARMEWEGATVSSDHQRDLVVETAITRQPTDVNQTTVTDEHPLHRCLSPGMGRMAGTEGEESGRLDDLREMETNGSWEVEFSRDDGSVSVALPFLPPTSATSGTDSDDQIRQHISCLRSPTHESGPFPHSTFETSDEFPISTGDACAGGSYSGTEEYRSRSPEPIGEEWRLCNKSDGIRQGVEAVRNNTRYSFVCKPTEQEVSTVYDGQQVRRSSRIPRL
jgi:hypothetical protein